MRSFLRWTPLHLQMAGRRRHQLDVLITDYDNTMTVAQPNVVPDHVWEALAAWKAAGNTLILATGRTLSYLVGPSGITDPKQLQLFDLIVAENGGVLWDPHTDRVTVLGAPPSPYLVNDLRDQLGDQLTVGQSCITAPKQFAGIMALAVAKWRLKLHPIEGLTSMMYTDRLVTKISGIRVALQQLDLHPARCIAVGDGDNDIPMLDQKSSHFGMTVAVANADPRVQEYAQYVTVRDRGDGLVELIRSTLSRRGISFKTSTAPRHTADPITV